MKWSYKAEVIRTLRDEGWTGHNTAEIEDRLNARSKEGWALVQLLDVPTGFLAVYVQQRVLES